NTSSIRSPAKERAGGPPSLDTPSVSSAIKSSNLSRTLSRLISARAGDPALTHTSTTRAKTSRRFMIFLLLLIRRNCLDPLTPPYRSTSASLYADEDTLRAKKFTPFSSGRVPPHQLNSLGLLVESPLLAWRLRNTGRQIG